jgi:hypothetical protein
MGFTLTGDLSQAARVSFERDDAAWLQRIAPRLLDGLPEYLSVRRDPPPGSLTGTPVHFLRPGDPFFEGLCDEVVQRCSTDTQRGGIFRDPTTEKPYGVAFYVCQIGELADLSDVDGGSRTRNLLDRRLLAVRWDEEGQFNMCAPNYLLALQPAPRLSVEANRLLGSEEQVQRCDRLHLTGGIAFPATDCGRGCEPNPRPVWKTCEGSTCGQRNWRNSVGIARKTRGATAPPRLGG